MNILIAMIPAFFWGTTYAVTKYTLADWPPLLLGAIRALPAGLLLLALRPSLPEKSRWRPLLTIGLVNIAAFFSLIFVMALTLPSAISGVGMVSVPVFAMFYHWLVSRQRPSSIQLLSGAALIALAWFLFDPKSLSLNPLGLMAMLAAILCIIFGSTLTKSLGGKIHWWTVLSWQLIIGGVALSLAALVHAFFSPQVYMETLTHISTRNILGLLWIVLLNTALGYGLYVWLLQRMSVVDFTFGGIANPVAGIVCGGLLLNEIYRPDQYALMGGMIVMSLLPQVVALIRQRHTMRVVSQQ
ncbi:DMT family transporter [Vibrio fluvialis]|uniref:DMT family transporter n=1 Tax=Vibrio fluvialis TaxID=676 RepID=UPI0006455EFA|nr:EamA family transporter [Vibrio fluvialis]EKO3554930.1 EamA family transporter [Vibrio fluvialis]EKO3915234.1 EamA family transporter [Vibrio fluvialis]EKO3969114.1 EamA family transporter [Vibrio fluvialis]ELI1809847.1 EamA family transporter [Vibrio fluvialis]ELL9330305.1 EamA family transporter [Vibrio fluvialis]